MKTKVWSAEELKKKTIELAENIFDCDGDELATLSMVIFNTVNAEGCSIESAKFNPDDDTVTFFYEE